VRAACRTAPWTIRKEAIILTPDRSIRPFGFNLFCSLALIIVCSACSAPKAVPNEKEKEKPVIGQVKINTSNGEAIERKVPSREISYHIKWETAQVAAGDKGISAGRMDTVSGEMYDKGEVVNTFKADHADADRSKQLLILTGHVQVDSKGNQDASTVPVQGSQAPPAQKSARIVCERLEWHAVEKVFLGRRYYSGTVKAFHNIDLTGSYGVISGLDELWATPDLTHVGTPEMFKSSE